FDAVFECVYIYIVYIVFVGDAVLMQFLKGDAILHQRASMFLGCAILLCNIEILKFCPPVRGWCKTLSCL
ncbi:hypothetical protein, partial [Mycoplasma yeatsii]